MNWPYPCFGTIFITYQPVCRYKTFYQFSEICMICHMNRIYIYMFPNSLHVASICWWWKCTISEYSLCLLMDFFFQTLGAIGANTLLGCFWVVFCNNYGMVLDISKHPLPWHIAVVQLLIICTSFTKYFSFCIHSFLNFCYWYFFQCWHWTCEYMYIHLEKYLTITFLSY